MNTPTAETLTDRSNGTVTVQLEVPTALYKLMKTELPMRAMTKFINESTAKGMVTLLGLQ